MRPARVSASTGHAPKQLQHQRVFTSGTRVQVESKAKEIEGEQHLNSLAEREMVSVEGGLLQCWLPDPASVRARRACLPGLDAQHRHR